MTLSNLQYWLIDVGVKSLYHIPNYIYIQFELLIVPFFYLFSRSYLQKEVTRNLVLLVLTPFVLGTISLLITQLIPALHTNATRSYIIAESITILYSLSLIILVIRAIYTYEKQPSSGKIRIHTRWLKLSILFGMVLFGLWILVIFVAYRGILNNNTFYYPLWIAISAVIYWAGYKGIFEFQLYKDRINIRKKNQTSNETYIFRKVEEGSKKIALLEAIEEHISAQKMYLDPELNAKKIAEQFSISSGYLSQLINQNRQGGFNDLINGLRVEEGKRMLLDKEYANYTIDAIALESGFQSKSNFYVSFKKFTQMTPSEYRKKKENN